MGTAWHLAMIVPTRSRPHNIERMMRECALTENTTVVVGYDYDDPSAYEQLAGSQWRRFHPHFEFIELPWREYLVAKLNRLAVAYAALGYTHVGFMGDDHVPRTPYWDRELTAACGPFGFAFGNDLEHGDELPTSIVMSAEIVRLLGSFCPADVRHLCCDMVWRDLAETAGMLSYRPDVVIEHLHPEMEGTRHRGGAPMDAQYEATRTPEMYEHDNAAYRKWRETWWMDQVLRLQAEARRQTAWVKS